MNDVKMKTVCPLPWIHFSAHLDATMRICCNTDHSGFVFDNDNKNIKLSEVNNIKEYFNLNFYKDIRQKMLLGEKPKVCKKCYEVEEAGGSSVREGYLSHYRNDPSFINSLKETTELGEITPNVKSLDFSLSNLCNLKCIMCSPEASYLIKKDFDKLGIEYNSDFAKGANLNWNDTQMVERIIPQIAPSLTEFLTTGGEPFLNNTHKKILEILINENHSSKIQLNYHTNCTVRNDELFKMWNEFQRVSTHFSIDAFGELNEYIRYKTKWNKVEQNVDLMLSNPKVHAEVHSCVQVLNIFNLTDLYDWINTLGGKIPQLPFHIWMDQPSWLHINILPEKLKVKALKKLEGYFQIHDKNYDSLSNERKAQIISYLNRSISSGQDTQGLEVFKERIRAFEKIRNLQPIESIVPEFKEIFKKKKFFFF